MRKLVEGIVRFRREMRPGYRERFAHLALEQSPDTLFVACSDSRVVPNAFASTDPGDLFVLRNPGNIVPPEDDSRVPAAAGAAAAVEFAVRRLGVTEVVVCGHSDCGVMKALAGEVEGGSGPFGAWLRAAGDVRRELERRPELAPERPIHDRMAQANALVQLGHLRTHAPVREALAAGRLRLHAWWFDLAGADVHAWEPSLGRFTLIDEAEAEKIYARLDSFPESDF
ncbi:MAG: carbonic anhydrase [Elusimicrobia bacterium]|nr:carbonic anhydrase [Elusimicrobiota bacterium]